jgi:hypothetical protein
MLIDFRKGFCLVMFQKDGQKNGVLLFFLGRDDSCHKENAKDETKAYETE